MLVCLLKAKIHGAVLTATDLHYEGSIAVDARILEAAGILAFERLDVWNVNNGARLTTYAIASDKAGAFMLNGAAARLAQPGDRVILSSYAYMDAKEARGHTPRILIMDENNTIAATK